MPDTPQLQTAWEFQLQMTEEQLQMIVDALDVLSPDDPDKVVNVLLPLQAHFRNVLDRIQRHEMLLAEHAVKH